MNSDCDVRSVRALKRKQLKRKSAPMKTDRHKISLKRKQLTGGYLCARVMSTRAINEDFWLKSWRRRSCCSHYSSAMSAAQAADPHQFITQIRRPSTCVSVGRGNSDTRPSDTLGDFSVSLIMQRFWKLRGFIHMTVFTIADESLQSANAEEMSR